jgi:hypothetical protein
MTQSHPALELAHGELPDHQHAGLAVVESRAGDTINLQRPIAANAITLILLPLSGGFC